MKICGVNGCNRRAVTEAPGWPSHKENVHDLFHGFPFTHCDSDTHGLIDCEDHLREVRELDMLLIGRGGYDWEELRKVE
jgi:hypothetical protein